MVFSDTSFPTKGVAVWEAVEPTNSKPRPALTFYTWDTSCLIGAPREQMELQTEKLLKELQEERALIR